MKLSKRKVCSVILSMSVIAGSIAVPAYGAEINNFVPQITAIDGDEPVEGKGIGQSGESKDLLMVRNKNGGEEYTYYLRNTVDNFQTCEGKDGWASFDSGPFTHSSPPSFGPAFSEADDNFDSGTDTNYQKAAVDAHSNVTKVINYFKQAPFYRNSQEDNDEKDEEMIVGIITNDPEEPYTSPIGWGSKNYLGLHIAPSRSGKTISHCLDVVAHEYSHGILQFEGLTGFDQETRAVSEGVGDVFGVLAEHYMDNEGSEDDWIIGEDILEVGEAWRRDASNPNIKTYDAYDKYIHTQNDGGGLISRAASLMALGDSNVNAIGYGKMAHIFYNAINDGYLTTETSLQQFANYVLLASGLLYGDNSQAYQSTKAAFTSVGLLVEPPANFNLSVNNNNVNLSWNAIPGSRVGVYKKASGTKAKPDLIASLTDTNQYTLTDLIGSYDFYVGYVDESGNMISRYSEAKRFEYLTKNAPTNFRMTNRSGLLIQLSWSGTRGDKFAVYRKISDTNDEFLKVGETENRQITVDTLRGICDFKVAVVSSDGTRISPLSDVKTVEAYSYGPRNFELDRSTSTFSWEQAYGQGIRYAVYKVKSGSSDTPQKVADTKNTFVQVDIESGYDYQVAIVDFADNRISYFSNVAK